VDLFGAAIGNESRTLHAQGSATEGCASIGEEGVVSLDRLALDLRAEGHRFGPDSLGHGWLVVPDARVGLAVEALEFHPASGSKSWKQKQRRNSSILDISGFPDAAIATAETPVFPKGEPLPSLDFTRLGSGRNDWIRTSDPHTPRLRAGDYVFLVAFWSSKNPEKGGQK
jgi:hypothetical protein